MQNVNERQLKELLNSEQFKVYLECVKPHVGLPKDDQYWVTTAGPLLMLLEALANKNKRFTAPIVCLCGSTRFMDVFFEQGWKETMKGHIVLSVGVSKHTETEDGGHVGEALGPSTCAMLDELHKRKIDLADEVLVLNVGGYIGESTRSEIEYAKEHGKPVRYLEAALLGKET